MKKFGLVKNIISCKKCGDAIESRFIHDYKECKCEAVAIDGDIDLSPSVYQDTENGNFVTYDQKLEMKQL